MGTFSGNKRARHLGLDKLTEEEYRDEIERFIKNPDTRRVMWVVEAAVNDTAEKIEAEEQRLIMAERFGNADEKKSAEEYRARYIEDFKFVFCLAKVVRDFHMNASVADFREYFNAQKQQKPSTKTPKIK